MLNSKYPIVAMPMNGVSTVNLAVAVHKAGAFPSISVFNYYRNRKIELDLLTKELNEFQDRSGSSNILVSMLWEEFMDPNVFAVLDSLKIRHIELFIRPMAHPGWPALADYISNLRKQGFKIFFKTAKVLPTCEFDSIVLKGSGAAGRSFPGTPSLEEHFATSKEKLGANVLIPSGGIGSPEQVSFYMNQGAMAVGIGTLIAASEESRISAATKQKIIESTSKDIEYIGPLNCRGLLFSRLENDDENNTRSLMEGIKGTQSGCIYVGNGIDYIDKIMPVKDIIEHLCQNVN